METAGREVSGNPSQPTKGRRIEPPQLSAPLPEDCTQHPFVLELIKKSNASITVKNRIKSKQALTQEAVRLALLRKDISLGEEVIRDSISVRRIFPKPDVSITPILHAFYRAGEYQRGVALFNWVKQEASGNTEIEKAFMDDAVLTVGMRLLRASGSGSSTEETKQLLGSVPRTMVKRRLLNSVLSGCIPEEASSSRVPDWDLMLYVLKMGQENGQDFWDKDFLTMLDVVEACDKAGLDYPKRECLLRILRAMEDHHPTVGTSVATKLCQLVSNLAKGPNYAAEKGEDDSTLLAEYTAEVNPDTGFCAKCGNTMQGFTFSDEDFARLEADILEKLVEPSFSRVSHYDKQTKETIPEEEQAARRKRFAEFNDAVRASDFDALIDGANVGYYGVTNWYSLDKKKQLIHNGRNESSIPAAEVASMPLPIDICPRFDLVDRVMEEAIKLGYNPKVVLHERHVVPSHRLFGDNAEMVEKWKSAGRLLDSPPFLNDDYCWLYACSVKKKCVLITNDQMRDHHFKMLSQRNFIRWRQRHRITFRNGFKGLKITLPTVFSTWVQSMAHGDRMRWHVPFLNTPIIEQDTNKGLQEHTLGKDGDDGCDGWVCLEL